MLAGDSGSCAGSSAGSSAGGKPGKVSKQVADNLAVAVLVSGSAGKSARSRNSACDGVSHVYRSFHLTDYCRQGVAVWRENDREFKTRRSSKTLNFKIVPEAEGGGRSRTAAQIHGLQARSPNAQVLVTITTSHACTTSTSAKYTFAHTASSSPGPEQSTTRLRDLKTHRRI